MDKQRCKECGAVLNTPDTCYMCGTPYIADRNLLLEWLEASHTHSPNQLPLRGTNLSSKAIENQ